jgi:hypothetical protein
MRATSSMHARVAISIRIRPDVERHADVGPRQEAKLF